MKPAYFVCNGILSNPGDVNSWTDLFEDYYQNLGFVCNRYEYFCDAITRFIKQRERVDKIVQIIKRINGPIVYVGHSNGCELFDKVVRRHHSHFESAHLFAAAMEPDFNKNGLNYALLSGKLKNVYLYCSKGDVILREYASRTSFLRIFGLGYGTLGYTGPKNILKAVQNRVFVTWKDDYNHSDWFKNQNIEGSFALTLRGSDLTSTLELQ